MKRPASKRPAAAIKRPATRTVETPSAEVEGEVLLSTDDEREGPSQEDCHRADEVLLASDEEQGDQLKAAPPLEHSVWGFVDAFCNSEKFADLRQRVDKTWRSCPTVKVGSLFSGWGVCEMVLQDIESRWDAHCPDAGYQFQAELHFMCENDKRKQEYLRRNFPTHVGIFDDATELGKVHARTMDGSTEQVPKVDLLVGGFPCVSISPLTMTPGSVTDPECSSGSGFLSIERYCKKHRPSLLCLENVKSIFHCRKVEGGESGYSNMKKRLEKLGYVIAAAECNAADFGVPQQRRRAWVLGILKSELKTNSEQLIADLNTFKCKSLSLLSCIDLKKVPPNSTTKGGKTQEENNKWKDGLKKQCEKFGKAKIMERIRVLTPLATSCSEREVAILACAVEELWVEHDIDAMKEVKIIQVDQNFSRSIFPKRNTDTMSCVIPGGKYIVTGSAGFREISPKELAMMQGIGEREWWYYKMNEVPDKLMRSFIGNAFCAPIQIGALLSLFANWEPEPSEP